jgi:Raf kinase inhibitor-like YbhB/YbcL family protein
MGIRRPAETRIRQMCRGRRLAVPAGLAVLAALAAAAAAAPPPAFRVTSSAFTDGAMLTAANANNTNACGGQNISPALNWSGAPAPTQSFAIVMFDPDGFKGLGVVHWVAYNIPASKTSLATGEASAPSPLVTGGTSTAGTHVYRGPCPPVGDNPHHYLFTVYALDLPAGTFAPGLTRDQLLEAIRTHVLAATSIVGRYARKAPSARERR